MRSTLLLATVLLFVPPPVQAQEWSPAEQEIVDFTANCWDMWQQAEREQYFSQCWHEDITFWWSGWLMPVGMSWIRQNAQFFFGRGGGSTPILDFQAHSVNVFGDAAVLTYQLLGADVVKDGAPIWWGTGRTDFLVRENGAWKVVAVHQHAAPQNPYGN
jgi:hypothetical protein